MALYVEQRFAIVAGDEPVALELIGAEVRITSCMSIRNGPCRSPPACRVSQPVVDRCAASARTWVRFQARGLMKPLWWVVERTQSRHSLTAHNPAPAGRAWLVQVTVLR